MVKGKEAKPAHTGRGLLGAAVCHFNRHQT